MDDSDPLSDFLIPPTVCAICGTFTEGKHCGRCHTSPPAPPTHSDTWQAINNAAITDLTPR